MKNHTKVYFKSFGYTDTDFIPSELTGKRSVDLHHIVSRGKGGEDRIENLMALTRDEHVKYGDKKQYMTFLLFKHYEFLLKKGVDFKKEWFDEQFHKYEDEHLFI